MDWREETKADHKCACTNCDDSLAVKTERQGEQHIAVRFWDKEEVKDAAILLNGNPLQLVFEAILGEAGTVWRYRESVPHGKVHRCLTCSDQREIEPGDEAWYDIPPCTEKLTGKVELRRRSAEAMSG